MRLRRAFSGPGIAALLLTCLLAPWPLSAQPVGSAAPAPAAVAEESVAPIQVDGSEVRVLRAANGRTHRAYVWVPSSPPPARGYPIIYVLDGETTFMLVRDAARSLAAAYPGVDPPVVVALGYDTQAPYAPEGLATTLKERTYDYTPAVPADRLGESFNAQPWPPTGGADAFLDFIEDQLKPSIEAEFPIDRERQTLMGHSFGGLFTLHVLFNRPEAFSTYVASSPSVWYGTRHIEQAQREFSQSAGKRLDGKRLLLTVGGLEQTRAPERGERAKAEWLANSRMVDGVRELAERMQALRAVGLETRFREYPGESHLSVKHVAANYGVRFALAPIAGRTTIPASTPTRAAKTPAPVYAVPRSERWQAGKNGEYEVSVLLPAFPPSLKAPAAGYPLIYLLDAERSFGVFADVFRRLEGGGMLQPAILIGIDGGVARIDAGVLPATIEAIEQRLRQRHAIDPSRRLLIGQGAEAAQVLRSLYLAPRTFDAYAALSPPAEALASLGDEERAFMERALAARAAAAPASSPRTLLLMAGAGEAGDFPGALQDGADPRTATALRALADRLKPVDASVLDTRLRVFTGEDNRFSTTVIAETLLAYLGTAQTVKSNEPKGNPAK